MKITVFGEILWDVFGEEKKIGGAPFNFAAHTHKLGANVRLISAVGKDELGEEALNECKKLGLSTDGIEISEKPTGNCQVKLENGTPVYDIVEDVAYDNICSEEALSLDTDVFYFGTLAQRNVCSRNALYGLLEKRCPEMEAFFDINIRQNYYSDEIIENSLKAATILKISREEIGVLGIEGAPEEVCKKVSELYPNLKMIIVTLDSDGAFAFERGGQVTYSPKPCCNVVSTVGAGDSFSAAFLVNLVQGHSVKECLEAATKLAGYVCEHVEAVPQ